jgi:hypothetical protein
MSIKNGYLLRFLWASIFPISLGASIALNFIPIEISRTQQDISSIPGWFEIVTFDGKTYFYNEPVGLVKEDSGQVEPGKALNFLWDMPFWLLLQVVLVAIGLTLVLIRRPQPLGFKHRLNVALGFLLATWLNLAVFIIRFQQSRPSDVPVGYSRIGMTPKPTMEILPSEIIGLLGLGLGISIILAYLWIRWDRTSSSEEYFL